MEKIFEFNSQEIESLFWLRSKTLDLIPKEIKNLSNSDNFEIQSILMIPIGFSKRIPNLCFFVFVPKFPLLLF